MNQCKKCNKEFDLSEMKDGYCQDCVIDDRKNNLLQDIKIKDIVIIVILSIATYHLVEIKSNTSSMQSDISSMQSDTSSMQSDISSMQKDIWSLNYNSNHQ